MDNDRRMIQLEPVHNLKWICRQLGRWENIPLYLVLFIKAAAMLWYTVRHTDLTSPGETAALFTHNWIIVGNFVLGCLAGGLLTVGSLYLLGKNSRQESDRLSYLVIPFWIIMVLIALPTIVWLGVLALVAGLVARVFLARKYKDSQEIDHLEIYDPDQHHTRLGRRLGMLSWERMAYQVETILLAWVSCGLLHKLWYLATVRFAYWKLHQPYHGVIPSVWSSKGLVILWFILAAIVVLDCLFYPLNPWRKTLASILTGHDLDLNYTYRIRDGRLTPVKTYSDTPEQNDRQGAGVQSQMTFKSFLAYLGQLVISIIVWYFSFILAFFPRKTQLKNA